MCIEPGTARSSAVALLAASLLGGGPAYGTGFFVNQQSVRGLGRVNAGVAAAADDAATIFFNPAGLAQLWRDDALSGNTLVSAGVQLIVPRADFTNTGSLAATPGTGGVFVPYAGANASNPTDPTPVPDLYYARRLATEGVYLGVGITSPFGLSTRFGTDWFGRYDATQASLTTINLGTVLAYQLHPALSLGVGFDIQYARTKLTSAIPNPATAGGPTFLTDGQIKVSGDAWTPGFNVGALLRPDQFTLVGVSYRSGFNHGVSGDAVTSGLTGPLAFANGTVGAHAEVKLPAVASAGIARKVTEKLKLFAQFDWYNWSTFSEIRVTFDDRRADAVRPQKYRNAWAASVGGDYAMSQGLVLRGGIRFDQTPTVDGSRDTIVPDANRFWMGVGATYRLSPRSSIDLAFTHVLFRSADVDVTRGFFEGTEAASTVRVRSEVDTHVNTLAASFNHAF
jgi:long-chain fatty acid transport protein